MRSKSYLTFSSLNNPSLYFFELKLTKKCTLGEIFHRNKTVLSTTLLNSIIEEKYLHVRIFLIVAIHI